MQVVIIDPASTEFNRGSFCYLPYLLYCALKEQGHTVHFAEDFTMAQMDTLPKGADAYLVSLWSYPQIDCCETLKRFLPEAHGEPSFFGYYPIIDMWGFKKHVVSEQDIKTGMFCYPKYFQDMKFLLLSDCDMHLTKYEGQVYPLFTSYGCPNGCAFCPSTTNTRRKRLVLPREQVSSMLKTCHDIGVKNIHFTDEDFFYHTSRAEEILRVAASIGGFNFIALGGVESTLNFVKQAGASLLEDAGMRLIEVGLETADPALSNKMGKPPFDLYEKLAEMELPADIFWLTMTFFPGETISTLNATGMFLQKYGFKLEEVYGRIRTNSTFGGLGQFFQAYPGTTGYDEVMQTGMHLSSRPIRLIPSYVPMSFLNCTVDQRADYNELLHQKWFRLYNLKEPLPLLNGKTVQENILTLVKHGYNKADVLISLAILARLGLIQEKKNESNQRTN